MILTFFISSLYENTIASDIMVPTDPERYPSLRETIIDNVKILVRQS